MSPIVAPLLQDAEVYAIKEAGLQFSIPKGWKVEKQDNGNVVLSFEDGKGGCSATSTPGAVDPNHDNFDADANPTRPWRVDTEIRVFALALTLGKPGHRHWLV